MGFKLYRIWKGVVFGIRGFYALMIALWLLERILEALFFVEEGTRAVLSWICAAISQDILPMLLFDAPLLNTLFLVVLFVSTVAYLTIAKPPHSEFVHRMNEKYALDKIPICASNIASNYKIKFRHNPTMGFGICDIMNYDLDSDFCKKYLAYKEAQLAKVAQKHNQKVTKAELYWQKVYEEEAKNAKKEAENERVKKNNIARYFDEQNKNNT